MIPLAKTGVPQKYATPVEGDYELQLTDALQSAQQWRSVGALLLVLSGHPGSGKSMAAASVLHSWWRATAERDPWGKLRPYDGRLWIAAVHLARYQPWADEVAALEEPGMLVLDDLGEEEATPKALSMVSDLITTRFAGDLATIITTNLDGPTFKGRYGTRITDRLRECGLDARGKARWWVKCTNESLRGRVEPKPRVVDVQAANETAASASEEPCATIGEMADAWLAKQRAANESEDV